MASRSEDPPDADPLKTNVRIEDGAPLARWWRGLVRLGSAGRQRETGRSAAAGDPGLVRFDWAPGETVIRPLLSTEAGAYLAHLVRLDEESRRHRFGRPVADRELARFVASTDWERALVLAHIEDGAVRGAAHLAWPDIEWLGRDGELAVAVEAAWRRRGIGRTLLERATGEARARGLAGIMFFTQADNEAMLSLARRLEAPLSYVAREVEGRVPLAPLPAARPRYFAGMAV
jgi:GNAT superfamily N-acetyltransferase